MTKILQNRALLWAVPLPVSMLVAGAAILSQAPGEARPVAAISVWPSCPSPAAIPAGYDYPQSAKTIEGWVASDNLPRARQHGWNLWAALNSAAGTKSVWQSWCTETQAFSPLDPRGRSAKLAVAATPAEPTRPMRKFKLDNGPTAGSEPINFPVSPVYNVPAPVAARYKGTRCLQANGELANGATLQNNGDVMIAGVIYNKPGFDWIRGKELYRQSTLNGLVPPAGETRQIPPMPSGTIALKPMLWPVKRSGFTALPVWDSPASDNGVYSGFEIQSQWPRAVAVTPTPQSTLVPSSVSFLYGVTMANGAGQQVPLGPNTYQRPRVVGIDQFYHYQPNLKTMDLCDRALLDASSYYANGRLFEQGDYLALVAMHLQTKEQAAWTFQSVWWHDRPNVGPYAADRPAIPQARGPWQHYLMTSTYGMPAVRGGKTWPIAYNPYIELAAAHPIKTNCMNCHHRSAWPADANEYQEPGGPGALDIYRLDNPVLAGKIQVDSLWSISDRAIKPSTKPVGTR